MIESTCPTCGQKVIEPTPPENIRTQEQKIAFRKTWDSRVTESQKRGV